MMSRFTALRLPVRALLALLALPLAAQAQLQITQASTPTTESFNGMGTATAPGTAAPVPTGFKLAPAATLPTPTTVPTYAAPTNVTATTQSTTYQNNFATGGTYNFGSGGTTAATATDRALGFLSSGGYALPGHILLAIQNTTGAPITDLKIQFDLKQFRANTQQVDWKFFASPDGSTWTSQPAGDQNFPSATASTYSFPPAVTTKTVTLAGLNLANNATYYLRWTMQYGGASAATNGQGIGLDNLVLTPAASGAPAAASIATTPSAYASPYCLTSAAGSAAFNVAYTTTGTFGGPTFQAQLSDASGTFPADPTANLIGSGTTSPLAATLPAGTPSGTGYRLRVLNGAVVGSDNGTNLTVTLAPATNPVTVAPSAAQTFAGNASGTALTATPAVPSAFAWFYGTAAGGPFTTALPGATAATYQPQGSDFAAGPGTYYVVAQATSTCGGVAGTSAPVTVTVTAAAPTFAASVATLPDFGPVPVGSTSAARSFTVSGSGLTGDVTVTPPPGFEMRTGSTPFACCALVLSPSGGTLPSTPIDVRFAPLAAQAYAGAVAVTSPGQAEQDVAVAGTGTAPVYAATVTSAAPTALTTTGATAGGTVAADGGSAVTAYGAAWSTSPEPTSAGSHTVDGSGTGSFTSTLTGLRPGTQYYVRAYAANGQGTAYGEQYAFTTVAVPPADEPTASSTLTASAVQPTRLLLTFTGGTGAKHLVLAHLNGAVDQDPADATTYTASATFGQGSVLGSDADNFVVFAAAGDTLTVVGLRANTPYSFAVYDYNDHNTPYAENYRTTAPGTLALTTPALPPTRLLQEDFAYPAGTLLTANNWAAHSGAGTKPFTVTSGSLAYAGYSAGTGNATAYTGSGEDDNRQFPTVYARTAVYVSCLVNATTASTTGDYFLHLGPTVLSSTFRGRVFARKSATGTLQFGVAGSGAAVYAPTDYAFNTTYLLLLKYSFDETGNETDLFVNPAPSGPAYRGTAAADASVTETANSSPTDLGTVALRQGSSSPALTVDALTVATAFPLPSGPLPVTLTDFTAQRSGSAVELTWQTASEDRAAYFAVERSRDGVAFQAVQTVAATGTSSAPRAYGWRDAQAAAAGAGRLYYRLRSVDQDGTGAYSPVRAVALDPAAAGLTVRVYPNPFRAAPTLQVRTDQAGPAILTLADATGRTLARQPVDLRPGTTELAVPAAGALAPGLYLLRLQQGAQQQQVKLLRE